MTRRELDRLQLRARRGAAAARRHAAAVLHDPQGESGGAALDSLDPDAFAYTITAREIATA